MRALYLIPKNPPPKLNEKTGKWSKNCREFVKDILIKNPAKRPSCSEALKVGSLQILSPLLSYLASTLPSTLPSQ
jgi:hypothetical protein